MLKTAETVESLGEDEHQQRYRTDVRDATANPKEF